MSTPEQNSSVADIEAAAAKAAGVSQTIPRPDVTTAPPNHAPEKRRPGRPTKAEAAARANAQAAINAASGRDEAAPKTGAASKAAKSKAEKVTINANKLAGQLQGLHLIASKVTGIPAEIIGLSDSDAFALAESVQNLAQQYEISINPKVSAALQLAATAAMIYVPKWIILQQAIALHKAQQEAAARAAQQPGA